MKLIVQQVSLFGFDVDSKFTFSTLCLLKIDCNEHFFS